jgi:hypothetical protein
MGPQGNQGNQGPQGNQGAQGNQGSTGAIGPTGSTGPQGNQGTQGPAGPQGPQGATGPAGPQGNQGPTGPQGPTGLTGAAGSAGPQGLMGPEGPTGPRGVTGAEGQAGPTGLVGPTGAAGPAGPIGATGAVGPAGPIGVTGPQGATGSEGPAGKTVIGGAISYSFRSGFEFANPGSGKLELEAENPSEASILSISNTDGDGANVKAWLEAGLKSTGKPPSYLMIRSKSEPQKFHLYEFKAVALSLSSYAWYEIQHVSGQGTFSANEPLALSLTRTGNTGPTGATGATGPMVPTRTGVWSALKKTSEMTEVGEGEISFVIPISTELDSSHVHMVLPGEAIAACNNGTVSEPKAASGNLCVYTGTVPGGVAAPVNSGTIFLIGNPTNATNGASKYGAVVMVNGPAGVYSGTWAVAE